MGVLGINGSPRVNGNTQILLRHTLKAMEEEDIDSEIIELRKLDVRPCTACNVCLKEERCAIDDDLWPIYLKMKEVEAIIFATPVYFGSATPEMKAFMDRTGYIAYWNGRPFWRKVGGTLVVAERNGQNFTLAQLNFWFYQMGCFVPGSTGPTIAFGWDRGDVEKDKEGLDVAWNFGKNAAFLVKKLRD